MNFFKSRKKFNVSERDPSYKVKYLGNVQTSLMKGDGCVDKPTGVLWNNYLKTGNVGIEMKLFVTASGLKAHTKEQGLTEYRAHRISYCIAHPNYPRLFIWVYRHEGKKMKVELRCHAVLCKTAEKAKCMAVQLHEKLSVALQEFMREKTRRQNSRLILQRSHSGPPGSVGKSHVVVGIPLRKQFLSTGQNYKPPVDRSASAPKLCNITEDFEPEPEQEVLEEEEEEEGEEEEVESCLDEEVCFEQKADSDTGSALEDDVNGPTVDGVGDVMCGVYELEIGNDIDFLKRDQNVQYALAHHDSDDDSSESGFSEQDVKELTASENGSNFQETASDEGAAAEEHATPSGSSSSISAVHEVLEGGAEASSSSPPLPVPQIQEPSQTIQTASL